MPRVFENAMLRKIFGHERDRQRERETRGNRVVEKAVQ